MPSDPTELAVSGGTTVRNQRRFTNVGMRRLRSLCWIRQTRATERLAIDGERHETQKHRKIG